MPTEQKNILPGQIIEGTVQGTTKFGAFIQLENGTIGLVHISEIADTYVRDVNDYLHTGDRVRVKILNVSEGKVGLSIKQARERERPKKVDKGNLDDKLNRFFKESDERLQSLKLTKETKRRNKSYSDTP
ncbi:MAG: S1 RNA-binding domain-containing protein [Syntrophomonadaceae bacterium]|jgi:S1 RNA binding domain protein|nr:S1 RNA-binding domain-containing protein [Syntrophomonadaceae bacterium]